MSILPIPPSTACVTARRAGWSDSGTNPMSLAASWRSLRSFNRWAMLNRGEKSSFWNKGKFRSSMALFAVERMSVA